MITLSSSGSSDVVYTLDILRSSVVGKNSLLLDLEILPTSAQVSAGITSVVGSMSKDFSTTLNYYTVQLLPDIAEFTYQPLFDSASTATASTYILSRPAPSGVDVAVLNIPLGNQQDAPFVSMLGVTLLRVNITVVAEDQVTTSVYTFDISTTKSAGARSSTAGSGAFQGDGSSTGVGATSGPSGSASTVAFSALIHLLSIVAAVALLQFR